MSSQDMANPSNPADTIARGNATGDADGADPAATLAATLGAFSNEEGELEGLDGYAVKLPVFEGPLDLLLHLIRQNEVDITDIPIALIGEQYLTYIELMQELNLDVASEYLVMAATLALIKSRMLLPSADEDEEADDYDPRAELVQRLLEYQRYKEVAEALGTRRLLDRDVYAAEGLGPQPVPDGEREIEVGLFELIDAFRDVLKERDEPILEHEVETEQVTVRDCMLSVMETLERRDSVEFTELFGRPGGGPPTRTSLVATFLAILELARLAALHIYQGVDDDGAPRGAIRLRRAEIQGDDSIPWHQRITETM